MTLAYTNVSSSFTSALIGLCSFDLICLIQVLGRKYQPFIIIDLQLSSAASVFSYQCSPSECHYVVVVLDGLVHIVVLCFLL